MRILVVAGLLLVGLAGCTDAPVEDEPLVVDFAGEPEKEPEYLFKLFGDPKVDKRNRTVDMQIYHDGTIVDIISAYEAEPDGEREQLRSYLFREGEVTVQVYSEGEPQATMHWDPAECGGGPSDAIVLVDDARYGGWQGGIRIEYGCTPPS